jgi:hypothetical protein
MKSILKLPYDNYSGNLLWMPPYLYPKEDLELALGQLRQKGYWVSAFPENDGLTFNHVDIENQTVYSDFCRFFYWMDIKLLLKDEKIDYEEQIFKSQIIIIPISRLKISKSILSKNICLFPEGYFQIEKINVVFLNGLPFEKTDIGDMKSLDLRDLLTNTTKIDFEVFMTLPIIVFRYDIEVDKYFKSRHQEDSQLIKIFSQKADELLDLLRLHECDYNLPELLPAKPGIWNERYSTALIYFPKYKVGNIQAREVEIKTFIKGLGMDFFYTNLITRHPLLHIDLEELGQVGKIAKYALKLNTLIVESDDESMKFMQIMTLFEYLGDPNNYEKFQKLKGKLIACIAKDKNEYHSLSEKFKDYSQQIRTEIIHNAKRLEQIIPKEEERKILFTELRNHVFILIEDLIDHYNLDWQEYDDYREAKRMTLI